MLAAIRMEITSFLLVTSKNPGFRVADSTAPGNDKNMPFVIFSISSYGPIKTLRRLPGVTLGATLVPHLPGCGWRRYRCLLIRSSLPMEPSERVTKRNRPRRGTVPRCVALASSLACFSGIRVGMSYSPLFISSPNTRSASYRNSSIPAASPVTNSLNSS